MKFSGPVKTCFSFGTDGSCRLWYGLAGGVLGLGGGLRPGPPGPPPPLGSLSGFGSPPGGLPPFLGVSDISSSSFIDAAALPCSTSSRVWSFWESGTCVSGLMVAEELALPEAIPVAISMYEGILGFGCFFSGVNPLLVRNGVSCSLSLGVFGAGVLPVGYRPGILCSGVNGKNDRCI